MYKMFYQVVGSVAMSALVGIKNTKNGLFVCMRIEIPAKDGVMYTVIDKRLHKKMLKHIIYPSIIPIV